MNVIKYKYFIRTLVILLTFTVAACGGGGSGGTDGDDGAVFPPPTGGGGSGGGSGGGNTNTASVSGTISVANNSVVDSDTNDSNQATVRNNTTSTAQALPNPVTVGGYVRFGAGNRDNNGCQNEGGSDGADYFSMFLFNDQIIELIIADRTNGDLDLALIDEEGTVVDSSISANSNESVTVPADGQYFILVCAFDGASNYALAVGQNSDGFSVSSVDSATKLSAPIVVGEAIIEWQTSSALAGGAGAFAKATGSDSSSVSSNAVNQLPASVSIQGTHLQLMANDHQVGLYEMPTLGSQYSAAGLSSSESNQPASDQASDPATNNQTIQIPLLNLSANGEVVTDNVESDQSIATTMEIINPLTVNPLTVNSMIANSPTQSKPTLDQAAQNETVKLGLLTFEDSATASKFLTLQNIKMLNKRKDVRLAEPNLWRQPKIEPNDPGYPFQWHYPLIGLPEAWDITTGGENEVIVAVIDTGVLLNHPDLAGQLDPNDPSGFDFIRSRSNSGDGDGIDGNANDVGDSQGRGSSFHGTHVAGTVAAATNNGSGVAGVSWQAKIMPLRALGRQGGTSFDIRQAVLYAAGLNNNTGQRPPRRADIINLSLGGGGFSQIEQDVYQAARNEGVIIIAASGNEGSSIPSYPAAYSGVVSVSAVTIEKRLARYSNFGNTIDVAAPGGDTGRDVDGDGYADGVLSAGGNDSSGSLTFVYPFFQGTSMASPHMAGVVALMKSVHPALTPQQLDNLLASGAITEDLGAAGRDNLYGHGLIDAHKAVQEAVRLSSGSTVDTPPRLRVNPQSLGFGAFSDVLEFNADNSNDGTLTITSVTSSETWLTVVASDVDPATQLGRYTATVNRNGLADGAYEGEITITSSANTVVIPVIMQVGSQFTADLGTQYVLLVHEATGNVIRQQVVQVDDGEYDFEFTNVPQGTYRLVAGSDYDEDFVVCDRGEACGAYLTLDNPIEFSVGTANISGLNFTSGYETAFNAASTDASGEVNTGFGFTRLDEEIIDTDDGFGGDSRESASGDVSGYRINKE